MTERLARALHDEKIEYSAVLPYSACRETYGALVEREGFTPRSVVIFLVPYYGGECENLSRYAAAPDYHIALRGITDRLIAALGEDFPDLHAKGYGDHSPIDERHAALISGLGILGDSGLLINEKYGTYVFIGDVVTDITPELIGITPIRPVGYCSHCGSCRAACPTGILRGEGADCLSAVTQRKGELTEAEAELMREVNTVWGCDLCQSSCPYNASPRLTPIEFFRSDRIERLTTEAVGEMTKEEFSRRAFAWRGRKTVLRNLSLLGY